jgi:hypothetical protein
MQFGGPEVLRGQLVRLIELARLPNVTIQVLPFKANAYASFWGPFLLISPGVPELGTVVVDRPGDVLWLRDREDLDEYGTMFDKLVRHALPPVDPSGAPETHAGQDSLSLIQHILYAL